MLISLWDEATWELLGNFGRIRRMRSDVDQRAGGRETRQLSSCSLNQDPAKLIVIRRPLIRIQFLRYRMTHRSLKPHHSFHAISRSVQHCWSNKRNMQIFSEKITHLHWLIQTWTSSPALPLKFCVTDCRPESSLSSSSAAVLERQSRSLGEWFIGVLPTFGVYSNCSSALPLPSLCITVNVTTTDQMIFPDSNEDERPGGGGGLITSMRLRVMNRTEKNITIGID